MVSLQREFEKFGLKENIKSPSARVWSVTSNKRKVTTRASKSIPKHNTAWANSKLEAGVLHLNRSAFKTVHAF